MVPGIGSSFALGLVRVKFSPAENSCFSLRCGDHVETSRVGPVGMPAGGFSGISSRAGPLWQI